MKEYFLGTLFRSPIRWGARKHGHHEVNAWINLMANHGSALQTIPFMGPEIQTDKGKREHITDSHCGVALRYGPRMPFARHCAGGS